MSEPRRPSLFDLPLEPPEEHRDESTSEPPATPATRETRRPRSDERLPLFPDEDDPALDELVPSPEASRPRSPSTEPAAPREKDLESPHSPAATTQRPAPMPASLGARWRAGGLDLLLHVALALALALGSWLLGAPLEGFETLGLALFVTVFSFLYTVIPLAFWGRTLGMTQAGLVASGVDQERSALTFGQTALRWLGGLLTLTLLGVPTLLALLDGRSLTDRLSGSRTWRLPRSGDR